MFAIDERIVYPSHGVARINRIIEKKLGSATAYFYELTFINKPMIILVPVDNSEMVGIRRLSSSSSIYEIFDALSKAMPVSLYEPTATNWNKRNKEYQRKIRTGNLKETCEIYRDLKRIERVKGLSFGEKNLLLQTESLLSEEIALVHNVTQEVAIDQLKSMVDQCISLSKSLQPMKTL